ncbi:hypothetical protein [Streptomyces sp. NBC_01373]|uniref:hypothetical protein n=1 Tax=Streptomyces sp. NBC_01373 TaxID=2903843 RepID=UPI00224ECB03|nr:hypothetical protein [Streptomyces sp. NBC_01373]MCX4700030.1 hypothetical protein [Streptomyces sp. NBC_01373]
MSTSLSMSTAIARSWGIRRPVEPAVRRRRRSSPTRLDAVDDRVHSLDLLVQVGLHVVQVIGQFSEVLARHPQIDAALLARARTAYAHGGQYARQRLSESGGGIAWTLSHSVICRPLSVV